MEESIGGGTEGQNHFLAYMKESLKLQAVDPCSYSPLALAYIGDAVYELVIRTKVINHGSMQVNKMHKASAALVKAETQSNLIKVLEADLSAEEQAVFKRGRNAKSVTTARHATVIDYRMATGFEALIGYLYITERFDRIIELVSMGLDRIGELE